MIRSTLLILPVLLACNENKTEESTAKPTPPPPATSAPAVATASAAPSAAPVQKVDVEISSIGDTMTFDKATLTVPAKAEVHLTFHNNAKLDALPHNWVLLARTGKEAQIAADGLALGVDAGYLPKSEDILAATPLTAPKATSELTFTAPKYTGNYPFICTVPGHYLTMKGTLIVQ